MDQTTFGDPGGNCFSACVASILELPLAEVPYFMGADDWSAFFANWLRPHGFCPIWFNLVEDAERFLPGFYILGGKSSRGNHAVVAQGSTIVHDPHPSREGLLVREDCTILIPLDPARARRGMMDVGVPLTEMCPIHRAPATAETR